MPLARRPLDLILVGFFALFAVTSLVMEPYFVFNIDYHRAGDPFAAGWLLYATRWDPAFLDRPLFLRIMCGIDFLLFGPFYLVLIYAFIKERNWIRIPGLVFVGTIVYSTVEYFAWEFIGEWKRANIPMVVILNIPYTIVPLILGWRLRCAQPFGAAPHATGSRTVHAPDLGRVAADARIPR